MSFVDVKLGESKQTVHHQFQFQRTIADTGEGYPTPAMLQVYGHTVKKEKNIILMSDNGCGCHANH